MKTEAVLFDLFDTLLLIEDYETYYPPSLRKLYESLVKHRVKASLDNFSQAYFEVRDKFYSESRKSLEEPHFNVRVSQTLQKLGYNYDVSDPIITSATMAFADEFMRYVRLDAEAPDVLQKLSQKYKLALISNFAIPECGWKLLDKFGLKKFFNFVVISGEINRRKPSPEIFERALKALSVEASRAVFVGDMLDLDVLGSRNVGMKTILIERKPLKNVAEIKPDKIIKRLSELLSILETNLAADNNLY